MREDTTTRWGCGHQRPQPVPFRRGCSGRPRGKGELRRERRRWRASWLGAQASRLPSGCRRDACAPSTSSICF